jgi:hypothetical protein
MQNFKSAVRGMNAAAAAFGVNPLPIMVNGT